VLILVKAQVSAKQPITPAKDRTLVKVMAFCHLHQLNVLLKTVLLFKFGLGTLG